MAILKGFPPSNLINPTIRIPPPKWNFWKRRHDDRYSLRGCRCGRTYEALRGRDACCPHCNVGEKI